MFVTSCKQQPAGKNKAQNEFVASLTKDDSTQMVKLCDDCMELLKQKDLEGALTMLREYDDSTNSIYPLTEETRARFQRIFTTFPVLDYQRIETTFMERGLNNVKYEIVFGEENEYGVPKTSMMFNPVKVDDQWYITMKRADQKVDNTEEEYI